MGYNRPSVFPGIVYRSKEFIIENLCIGDIVMLAKSIPKKYMVEDHVTVVTVTDKRKDGSILGVSTIKRPAVQIEFKPENIIVVFKSAMSCVKPFTYDDPTVG